MFLGMVVTLKRKFKFQIPAYCLMPNHYHFLIQTEEENLGGIFKRIDQLYTEYFNRKYDRVGTLWQSRYKSWYVNSFKYFDALVRYIEQNPVKSGLAERVGEYIWTSGVSAGMDDRARADMQARDEGLLVEFYEGCRRGSENTLGSDPTDTDQTRRKKLLKSRPGILGRKVGKGKSFGSQGGGIEDFGEGGGLGTGEVEGVEVAAIGPGESGALASFGREFGKQGVAGKPEGGGTVGRMPLLKFECGFGSVDQAFDVVGGERGAGKAFAKPRGDGAVKLVAGHPGGKGGVEGGVESVESAAAFEGKIVVRECPGPVDRAEVGAGAVAPFAVNARVTGEDEPVPEGRIDETGGEELAAAFGGIDDVDVRLAGEAVNEVGVDEEAGAAHGDEGAHEAGEVKAFVRHGEPAFRGDFDSS